MLTYIDTLPIAEAAHQPDAGAPQYYLGTAVGTNAAARSTFPAHASLPVETVHPSLRSILYTVDALGLVCHCISGMF